MRVTIHVQLLQWLALPLGRGSRPAARAPARGLLRVVTGRMLPPSLIPRSAGGTLAALH